MFRIILTILTLLLTCPAWAATYYVRPFGETTGDGTSYASAFNGFAGIVWGEGGVVAGDTLYVCGNHTGTVSDGWSNNVHTSMTVGESGSEGLPITISGLCRDTSNVLHQGKILGTGYGWIANSAKWTGPDEFGAYRTNKTGSLFRVTLEYSPDFSTSVEMVNQTKVPDADWVAGSVYGDGTYFYWKPSDGSKNHPLAHAGSTSAFILSGKSYINIQDLYIENIHNTTGGAVEIKAASHNVNVLRNNIRLIKTAPIYVAGDNDNGSIVDNTIYDSACGMYFVYVAGQANPERWTISGNHIYDIEAHDRYSYIDAHGIGVQNGDSFTITENTIHNYAAWGIILYLTGSANTQQVGNNISKNNIYDAESTTGAEHTSYGIQINGTNTATTALQDNLVYCNVLRNTGTYGIYLKGKKTVERYSVSVLNNSVSGAGTNLYLDAGYTDTDNGGLIANNIFSAPLTVQFNGYYGDDSTGILLKNNDFYPETTDTYKWVTTNYSTIGALQTAMGAQASGNISADPKFTSTTNFHLLPGSPAINAGVNVCTAEGVPFATCTGNGTGYWYDKDNHKVPDAYSRIPIGSSAPGIGQHLMDVRPVRTILQ